MYNVIIPWHNCLNSTQEAGLWLLLNNKMWHSKKENYKVIELSCLWLKFMMSSDHLWLPPTTLLCDHESLLRVIWLTGLNFYIVIWAVDYADVGYSTTVCLYPLETQCNNSAAALWWNGPVSRRLQQPLEAAWVSHVFEILFGVAKPFFIKHIVMELLLC